MFSRVDAFPRSQIIEDEKWARVQRRRELCAAFQNITQLIINTGKYPKAEAAVQIVQALVAPKVDFANGNVIQLFSTKDEPVFTNAVEVSRYKAEIARYEYIEQKFPTLLFLLDQLNLAIKKDLADETISALLKGIIFLGADINVFISDGHTDKLAQHHKLERQNKHIPEEMYDDLRDKLYETYVHPQNGYIKAVWQIANVTINSRQHHFSDWIEVIAKPLSAELLEKYLQRALDTGAILKFNSHIELFEMLCESGRIQTISRLPNALLEKGYNFEKLRQSPKPEEISAIQKSILTNAPVYVS